MAGRTEIERRNYKLQRGTETIGGNKTIEMKAGEMVSSIKMCWAAEEDEFGWRE